MPQPHEPHGESMAPAEPQASRSQFGGPRLELPRFQFTASAPPAAQPQLAPAQPAPTFGANTHHAPVASAPYHAPARSMPAHHAPVATPATAMHANGAPTPMLAPTVRPAIHGGATPAPTWGASPTGYHAPAAVSVAAGVPATPPPLVGPARTPAAAAMASSATHRASVSWEHVAAPAEQGLLQRITPVHMGVLMVIVMVMMVTTSGPAAMTAKPTRLPALAVDGGGSGVPLPARAGTTATAAAAASAKPAGAAPAAARHEAAGHEASPATPAPKAKVKRRARMLEVGSARVRARVRSGGIPSPAAAANLAIAGGGRVRAADTGSLRMAGIPSPAASEQLGPQTLPYRPTDGVTLPRATGERDSHATDTHYAPAELAMEEPALPAMTPGAAAAQAERQVTINQLSGTSAPAPVAGGLAIAY